MTLPWCAGRAWVGPWSPGYYLTIYNGPMLQLDAGGRVAVIRPGWLRHPDDVRWGGPWDPWAPLPALQAWAPPGEPDGEPDEPERTEVDVYDAAIPDRLWFRRGGR